VKFTATPQEQLQIVTTGVVDLIDRAELLAKLEKSFASGKPLVVKLGADPSAPDIHLGHTVVLQKMRQFQALGHEVVFLIGDFTGRVGDPTGRKKTRPALTEEEVFANAETYKSQIGKILDLQKTRIEFNSRWLAPLNFVDILKLTSQYTVARMLERDDFANRYKNQIPISIVEFLYPLMQGYDSVALKADVELGGVDQTFNLLVGRDLQRSYGQPPQVIMTLPILEGLDGKDKMSKSLGNYVGINETPEQIFGKLMSIPDEIMGKYFELLTDLSIPELQEVKRRACSEPKAVKVQLAHRIAAQYHGEAAAVQAEAGFEKMFGKSGDGLPKQIEESKLSAPPEGLPLIRILVMAGLAPSGGEARRLIQQGGVRIDQQKQPDQNRMFQRGESFVLQAGKRGFRKVVLE